MENSLKIKPTDGQRAFLTAFFILVYQYETFIYTLFNDAVHSSHHGTSNDTKIKEHSCKIYRKNGRGLISGTNMAFVWRDRGKSRTLYVQ
jgi:hypothetical protein